MRSKQQDLELKHTVKNNNLPIQYQTTANVSSSIRKNQLTKEEILSKIDNYIKPTNTKTAIQNDHHDIDIPLVLGTFNQNNMNYI
jgi:hypothetical protein